MRVCVVIYSVNLKNQAQYLFKGNTLHRNEKNAG